ncbi:hypothetical protein FRC11_001438 [Ceratobasidium sp. 423]|nr:hypothetical protein FRC11_001438 [Ceratobasidium sp. 423]
MATSALCAEAGGTATASGVAAKVLSDTGSGTASAIISRVSWAIQQHQSSGRPSVGVMAIADLGNMALDNVVAATVNAGFHMVVTAATMAPGWISGASTRSPARRV